MYLFKWWTERDSNPRYRYQYASLAGMWFQPTHPSIQVFLSVILLSVLVVDRVGFEPTEV